MRVRSVGVVTILSLAGTVVGVVQSVVVAYAFGTSRQVEIFFAAVALETTMLQLTQTGQLTDIFLPIYLRIKSRGGDKSVFA